MGLLVPGRTITLGAVGLVAQPAATAVATRSMTALTRGIMGLLLYPGCREV
jgi:hypothetical protein